MNTAIGGTKDTGLVEQQDRVLNDKPKLVFTVLTQEFY